MKTKENAGPVSNVLIYMLVNKERWRLCHKRSNKKYVHHGS